MAPAKEAAVTTKATAKTIASRKSETTYLFLMAYPLARQLGAGAAIEAAVTTKATAKPIASRKMETRYLFFMVR
jgi:hypothetical protein